MIKSTSITNNKNKAYTDKAEKSSENILKFYLKNKYDLGLWEVVGKKRMQEYDFTFRKRLLDTSVISTLRVELKTRFFDDNNKHLLEDRDILLEAIQNTTYTLNKNPSPKALNVSVGWFYKCSANRLIQVSYMNKNHIYDIIDIDFLKLKPWLLDNMEKVTTRYSGKTTGSLNYVLKLKDIPKDMIVHTIGEDIRKFEKYYREDM